MAARKTLTHSTFDEIPDSAMNRVLQTHLQSSHFLRDINEHFSIEEKKLEPITAQHVLMFDNEIYVLNPNEKLGKGGAGSVYKGYRVTLSSPKYIVAPSPVAIKCIQAFELSADLDAIAPIQEAKVHKIKCKFGGITKKLTSDAGDKNWNIYILQTLFPGKPIISSRGELCPEVTTMNFLDRVNLICHLINEIHELHLLGIVHLDIKGENYLLSLEEQKTTPTSTCTSSISSTSSISTTLRRVSASMGVSLCDFGTTVFLARQELLDNNNHRYLTTREYASPEMREPPKWAGNAKEKLFSAKIGHKSDIYAITGLFLTILGSAKGQLSEIPEPLSKVELRKKLRETKRQEELTKEEKLTPAEEEKINAEYAQLSSDQYSKFQSNNFDFSDLQDAMRLNIPGAPLSIPETYIFIEMFLKRMASLDIDARPDAETVLYFFTKLKHTCKLLIAATPAELKDAIQDNIQEMEKMAQGQSKADIITENQINDAKKEAKDAIQLLRNSNNGSLIDLALHSAEKSTLYRQQIIKLNEQKILDETGLRCNLEMEKIKCDANLKAFDKTKGLFTRTPTEVVALKANLNKVEQLTGNTLEKNYKRYEIIRKFMRQYPEHTLTKQFEKHFLISSIATTASPNLFRSSTETTTTPSHLDRRFTIASI